MCGSTREVIVSYLDDDLLVVRDIFGSPEILRRKVLFIIIFKMTIHKSVVF